MTAPLRAEWLKQRSTRTTLGLLAAMVGLVVLVILLHELGLRIDALSRRSSQFAVLGQGQRMGTLFAALLGALSITVEFRHGTIRPTFLVNLVQLFRHAGKMRRHMPRLGSHGGGGHTPPEIQKVEWSDTHGIISVGWGTCTLRAVPGRLIVLVEAADEAGLQRLKSLIAHRLETIGSRDHLKVTWDAAEAPEAEPSPLDDATEHARPAARRRLRWPWGLGGIVAIAGPAAAVHSGLTGLGVAVHVGVLGTVLAASRLLGANLLVMVLVAAGFVAVLVLVMVLRHLRDHDGRT